MTSDESGVAVDRGQVTGDSMRLVALGIFAAATVAVIANVAHSITGGGIETLAVAAGLCVALGAAFTALSYVLSKRGEAA